MLAQVDDLPVPAKGAQLALTRSITALLAVFRDYLSPSEIAVSMAAALHAENARRPFGSRAARIFAEIVELAEGDL